MDHVTSPLQADYLVYGDWVVVSPEQIIDKGAVVIANGSILEVGSSDDLIKKYPSVLRYGGAGRLVLPGFINTHTHLFQTFLKGLGQGLQLRPWIQQVTTPAALVMTERDAYLSAMVGLIEAVHSGVTTVFEYSYAWQDPKLHQAVLQAFVDIGLRGWLGLGLNDAGREFGVHPAFIQPLAECLNKADRFYNQIQGEGKARINLALTPSSLRGLSKDGLRRLSDFTRTHHLILSLHINETGFDNEITSTRDGMQAIPWLAEMDVLGPELLAVHCVQMDQQDIRLLAEADVKVSHNPVSNMYLGAGIAPVVAMRKAGITIGLGSDGAASNNSQDMIEAMKVAALGQRAIQGSPAIFTAAEAFGMATVGGAKALGQQDLGQLAPGYQADLTVWRMDSPKTVPVHNPLASVVFSGGQQNVETVIVGGQVLMEQGRLTNLDEAGLLAEAQRAASSLVARANIKA